MPETKEEQTATNDTPMPSKPMELMSPEEVYRWLRSHRTPLDHIAVREGRKGQNYYYIRHQHVTKALNDLSGFNWDFEIVRESITEGNIAVLGRLTMRIGDHVLVKEQYGSSEIKTKNSDGSPLSVGDDFKAASSDALKKCASLLGIGVDLSLPIQENTMKRLHAVGTKAFEKKWDEARERLIRTFTAGKKTSSKDLTDAEARVMIAAFEKDHSCDLVRSCANLLRPVAKDLLGK